MPTPDRNKRYVEGKGSWRRPEDREKFRRGWDRIFGNPEEQRSEQEPKK